jgi:hypothetical protein
VTLGFSGAAEAVHARPDGVIVTVRRAC